MCNNLCKPLTISIYFCSICLTGMKNCVKLYLGSDSNVPLGKGDLIDILGHIMVPTT